MAYIYNADIFCDSCGRDICKRIKREGFQPEDPDDQGSYDSDEYPKSCHGMSDEADCPKHCGSGEDCLEAEVLSDGSKVGCFLMNDLTAEGYRYVKESLMEDPDSEVVKLWADHYGISLPEEDEDEESDDDE